MEVRRTYNYELIKDYLEGLLDKETSARIRKLLMEDETARSMAKGILIMKESIHNEDVDSYLENVYQSNLRKIDPFIKPKKGWIYWKIAAAILFLAISSLLVFQSNRPSVDDIIKREIASPYPISQDLRSTQVDNTSKGIIAYHNGEFQKATQLLASSESVQGTFARGLSHFYLEDYRKAAEELSNRILQNTRYQEQSRWFLALSYIRSDRKTKAKETLHKIVNIKGHYKAAEAEKLLDLLSD